MMNGSEVEDREHRVPMSFLRASTVLLVVQVGAAVLLAANFFALAAVLPPGDLGAWSLLLTMPIVIMAVSSLGYHKAAIYYIGKRELRLETAVTNGALICAVLAAVLVVALPIFEPLVAALLPTIPYSLVTVMVLTTPLQQLLVYLAEASLSASLLRFVAWIKVVPTIIFVFGTLILILCSSATVSALVLLFLFAQVVTVLASAGYLLVSRPRAHFRPRWSALTKCLDYGWKAQVGEAFQYLANRTDLILVGIWTGTVAAGFYSVAVRLGEVIWYISNSVQLAFMASVARGADSRTSSKRAPVIIRWTLIVSAVAAVFVAAVAGLGVPLFLPKYVPALQLLGVLLPGMVAFAVFQVAVAGLLGTGTPAVTAKLRILLFSVSLVLYVLLIPALGALGASLGTSIGYTVGALAAGTVLARQSGFPVRTYFTWGAEDRVVRERLRQTSAAWIHRGATGLRKRKPGV